MARISEETKQASRARLLAIAAAHFAAHGFDRANINTIALEAGFAKGTIYNYFPSKEALFGAVLADACRRTVERYAASSAGSGVRERLVELVRADISILREEEAFMKVLVREAMSFRADTYGLIQQHLAPFLGAVMGILAPGTRSGEIRNDRPIAELALLFCGTLIVLFVQHWGSRGVWPRLDELPEICTRTFLEGAAPPAAAGKGNIG